MSNYSKAGFSLDFNGADLGGPTCALQHRRARQADLSVPFVAAPASQWDAQLEPPKIAQKWGIC